LDATAAPILARRRLTDRTPTKTAAELLCEDNPYDVKLPQSYNSDPALVVTASTPMTVDGSGDVWIGINRVVLEYTPTTQNWQRFDLPDVALVSSSIARPPVMTGASPYSFEEVDSLVAPTDGSIVVGRLFASVLQVISPSGLISSAPLPPNTVLPGDGPTDLAALANGGVAAVLYTSGSDVGTWSLGVTDQSGAWTEASGCSVHGVSGGADMLLGFGPSCLERAPEGGTGSIVAELAAVPNASSLGSVNNAVAVGNGLLLASSDGTEILVDPTSGAATTVQLGFQPYVPQEGPAGNSAGGATLNAPIVAGIVASNGSTQAWFTDAGGGGAIGLMTMS
jgi:hypothetical protein